MLADVVETAVGAVLVAQHGQAIKRGALRGAGGVVVNSTERNGWCRGAGGHRHHGGQDEG